VLHAIFSARGVVPLIAPKISHPSMNPLFGPRRSTVTYTLGESSHRSNVLQRDNQSREAAQELQPRAQALRGPECDRSPEGAKDMAQTCGNVVVHLIFSTKGRVPLITPEIRTDLFACLGGVIRELGGTALIIHGTADHVHVLARIRLFIQRRRSRVIKTNSS